MMGLSKSERVLLWKERFLVGKYEGGHRRVSLDQSGGRDGINIRVRVSEENDGDKIEN